MFQHFHLPLLLFLSACPTTTGSTQLYGIIRDKNSPTCSGALSGCSNLVTINPTNGTVTKIGMGHTTLAAVGDLAQIDTTHDIYYYLGDGWNGTGTLLIALDLNTGHELCATNLNDNIKTVGIVGGGQSLTILNNTIVVTGLSSGSGPHVILVAPLATNGCPVFQSTGSFPYSGTLPVAHSTTADETFHLYSTVATSPHAYGIDIIDLKTGGLNQTIPMAGNTKELWSLTYDNGYLVGPAEDGLGHLEWRTLDVGSGQWTSRPLQYSNKSVVWNNLWGNLGSIRSYNSKTQELHVLVSQGRSEKIHVATIDVRTGTMNDDTVVLLNGDLGYSSEVLMHMVGVEN